MPSAVATADERDAGAGDERLQQHVARAGLQAVAAGGRVQPGLDQGAAGLDLAGEVLLADLALGAQRDHGGVGRRRGSGSSAAPAARAARRRSCDGFLGSRRRSRPRTARSSRARAAARRTPLPQPGNASAVARARPRQASASKSSRIRPGWPAHHHHAVGRGQRLVDVVGDQDHGRPVARPDAQQMVLQARRVNASSALNGSSSSSTRDGSPGRGRSRRAAPCRRRARAAARRRSGQADLGQDSGDLLIGARRAARCRRGRRRHCRATLSQGISRGSWNTMPTLGMGPSTRRRRAGPAPLVGASRPADQRAAACSCRSRWRRPRATISPRATSRSMPASAAWPLGKRLETRRRRSASLAPPLRLEAVLPATGRDARPRRAPCRWACRAPRTSRGRP